MEDGNYGLSPISDRERTGCRQQGHRDCTLAGWLNRHQQAVIDYLIE